MDAERIVACVNACEELPDPSLLAAFIATNRKVMRATSLPADLRELARINLVKLGVLPADAVSS